MTVLSALMGWAAPTLVSYNNNIYLVLCCQCFLQYSLTCAATQISKQYTQYGAALLFFIFGFKMLYEVATTTQKVHALRTATLVVDSCIQPPGFLPGQHEMLTLLTYSINRKSFCCSHLHLNFANHACSSVPIPTACRGLRLLSITLLCCLLDVPYVLSLHVMLS